MLKQLNIKNYALIKQLEVRPSPHLNVITGETGAGKSIMLGALSLLMGNRAETKVLWDENEKCIIEGIFNVKDYKLKPIFKDEDLDYDEDTVIRREINPGGKSRAFINDTPVTLEVLRRIGSLLMDIHSQHETLLLGNQSFQLNLVDAFADNAKLLAAYQELWQAYSKARKQYETLLKDAETLRQEADYIHFQLDELNKAELEPQEQEKLEEEVKIAEHAEEIKLKFQGVLQALTQSEYAALTNLRQAKALLNQITAYSSNYKTVYTRLESLIIELDDIVNEVENEEGNIEFDPQRSEFVKERLSILYRLLKKHHVNNVSELLTIQESLRQKNAITSNVDEALAKAKLDYTTAEEKANALANQLSEARRKSFKPLSTQLTKLLKELGIPNATLEVELKHIDLSATGRDRVELLFSANKGISPKPLAQVASGGEFSRVMFGIKYIMAEKTAMPTLILDEIDNGVSGEVAIKLGNLMKFMSTRHQLISITHLPQIAAKGDDHYFVYKDNSASKTVSNIKRLQPSERIDEIAKMIGGEKPSKIALENAQELLNS